jgi:predicted xylose isomerase-like sugar epimerase
MRRWWARILSMIRPRRGHEAAQAVEAANESHRHAVSDKTAMAQLRVQADEVTVKLRAHNEANHFDTWLQQVMRGEGR